MILSDHDIEFALRGGLVIEPLLRPIQPVSVDLRLGDTLLPPRRGLIDPSKPPYPPDIPLPEPFTYYMLSPGQFVIMSTLEWIEIPPTLTGFLTGKSSLARIGLQVECAGLGDPGWRGRFTLELSNLGPGMIVLRPGMTICQIYFEQVSSIPQHVYGDSVLDSHYQQSQGPVAARFTRPRRVDPETNSG